MDEAQKSLELLKALKIGRDLRFVETHVSSVTTSWGVQWSPDHIARDLLQNFYDGNKDNLNSIKVKTNGDRTVIISAPSLFNTKELLYLGSSKGEDDLGKYGEGFKCATICLLRDHRVTPIMVSGKHVVLMRIADKPVEGTALYPMVYDFFESAGDLKESRLILRGCPDDIVETLKLGMKHFFYPGNPLLGQLLWTSYDNNFGIYKSKGEGGHIFYRRLKRGDIPDLPLIFVIHKSYKKIEDKISKDRDRNAFGDSLLNLFYSIFVRHGVDIWDDENPLDLILKASKKCWAKGHPLLAQLAYKAGDAIDAYGFDHIFGDKYYAKIDASHISNALDRERVFEIEDEWKSNGKIPLPNYFGAFGIRNAHTAMLAERKQAAEAARNALKRNLTTHENRAIGLLKEAMSLLSPAIASIFASRSPLYFVVEDGLLLGQMKKDRAYHSTEIYLSRDIFVGEFAQAMSVFLHEHSHIFGNDGSRSFTDALTALLENSIRFRSSFDLHEQKWIGLATDVKRDRKMQKTAALENPGALYDMMEKLPYEALKYVMRFVDQKALIAAFKAAEAKKEETSE